MNWLCAIQSNRNIRRGIERHHSMVPVVAQLLVSIAGLIEWLSGVMVPASIFWLIALIDLSLLGIVYLPIFFIRERLRLRMRPAASVQDSSE